MDILKTKIDNLKAEKKYALNGGPFGSKLGSGDYKEKGVPVIRGTNLADDCYFSFSDFKFVSDEKADELHANIALPGDIVFTQRGTLGQIGIIPKNSIFERFVISQSQMKLTVNKNIAEPLYVYYYFKNPLTIQKIKNHEISSGIPHINLLTLREFPINLPPLPIQRKIAAILSAYDDLIENNTRRIRLLENMAQEIYREWFVRFRFPGHESARFVDSPLGRIPEGWDVKELGECTEDIIDYRGKTPKKLGGDWSDSGIRALSALNIKAGHLVNLEKSKFISNELYLKWMKTEIQKTDILMTSEAPMGELFFNLSDERYCLSQRVFCLRPNSTFVDPLFMYFFLQSDQGQAEIHTRASGTTVLGIRQSALRNIPILLPSTKIQKEFGDQFFPIQSIIFSLSLQNTSLRRTRDLLLPRLMSGEIDVEQLDIDVSGLDEC